MTDVREKLMGLIDIGSGCPDGMDPFGDSCESCRYYKSTACHLESLADHLIANGVTVQECKLGDKIYQTDGVRIYESTIGEITLTAKHTIFATENIAFDEMAIGESIFLSYSEAEAHLPQPPKGE